MPTPNNIDLPDELIARYPAARREESRLLHLRDGVVNDVGRFTKIVDFLGPDDLLVLNDTGVFKARLIGRRASGGKVEVLLLERSSPCVRALVRPLTKLRIGERIIFGDHAARLMSKLPDGPAELEFDDLDATIEKHGAMPIPPYLKRAAEPIDEERYQTIFAREKKSVAAPTASLHFTPDLLEKIRSKGCEIAFLTLDVGYGTFAPVRDDQTELHLERYAIPEETVKSLQSGKRVVVVGTTVVRALETFAQTGRLSGETRIFIRPPFDFQIVQAMITNFHLPDSSLLQLVHAFAGESIFDAYRFAIAHGFRFYSYGDAMLIERTGRL